LKISYEQAQPHYDNIKRWQSYLGDIPPKLPSLNEKDMLSIELSLRYWRDLAQNALKGIQHRLTNYVMMWQVT
jgi:hypothetical protein